MDECPCGHDICTGECCHYSEEKEADIVIRVLNCDDIEVTYEYQDLEELKTEWEKEDDFLIPMLENRLVYGRVGTEEIRGTTVEDVFKHLKETCGWEY